MKAIFPLVLIISFLVLAEESAKAQQPAKVHRIGYLAPGSFTSRTKAFLQGLRELGYIEGQ